MSKCIGCGALLQNESEYKDGYVEDMSYVICKRCFTIKNYGQNAIVKKEQRFILNGGDASMGYALPASIGVCREARNRRVICLEGDGSIMMNIQELQTIKHNNLPIKIFVINNNGYSSIRQSQKNFFEGHMTASGIDSGVSVPDFKAVAKAFGIKSVEITNPKTMEDDIKMKKVNH